MKPFYQKSYPLGVSMESTMNIKELLKLVEAVCAVGNVIGEVFEDGKVDFRDAMLLDDAYLAAKLLFFIDYRQSLLELSDLNADERDLLKKYFKEELDIPQDMVEETLEKVMEIATNLYGSVRDVITLMTSMKNLK